MKNLVIIKSTLLLLFLLPIGILNGQDFTGKTEAEIAELFIAKTENGKNSREAKVFNSNVLKYYKSISPPNVSLAIDVKMADLFKEIYKKSPASAFQFMMTTEDRNAYTGMHPFLTDEHKKFIKEQARAKIAGYANNTNSTPSMQNPGEALYGGHGTFPQQFKKSNYTINFPRGTVSYNYSPLYLPRMKYKSLEVDNGFVRDLDYKYVKYNGSTYASVRFTPNIPSYHLQRELPERTTMVIMMVAMNHLFPSKTYLESKSKGGFYTITSDVKPLGFASNYNVMKENGTTIIAKAFRRYMDSDLIVQVMKINRDLKYESDLTADERYFLNEGAIYK